MFTKRIVVIAYLVICLVAACVISSSSGLNPGNLAGADHAFNNDMRISGYYWGNGMVVFTIIG